MDAIYCVESCPTRALILIDPQDIASGRLKPQKKGGFGGAKFLFRAGFLQAREVERPFFFDSFFA